MRIYFGYTANVVSKTTYLNYKTLNTFYSAEENTSVPMIYKIPNISDYLLISTYDFTQNKNYGRKFILLKNSNNVYKIISIQKSVGDSYILRPTFFIGQDTILILAETGAEYTWGIEAYEFKSYHLKHLGSLNIASYDDESYDDYHSSIKRCTVELSNSTYRFSFIGDIFHNPSQKSSTKINEDKKPVIIEYKEKFLCISHKLNLENR